jgi:gamma-glutamyltranspeptidase / glutathione hydrolase
MVTNHQIRLLPIIAFKYSSQVMKKTIILIILLGMYAHLPAQDRITGKNFATRSEVIAQHGMAATSHPLATQVAIDILKKGGSAVDAAIGANACLGLMEPVSNGIGGDLFAIVWDAKTQSLHGLNASGRSPKSLTLDYFLDNGYTEIPYYGPLPVSVPGCVDGWFELHAKFGKLSMKENLQPTIDYARNGFPMAELIAYYLEGSAPRYEQYAGFKEVFMPNGATPKKGEIFKNPYLANTLEKICNDGRDAFYKGDIARTIERYMKEQGGFLTYEDMASHKSEWVAPVSVNYRGYDVWELPPNGQGIAALQILNILEAYDLQSMGYGSEEYMHLFIEAKKLAFEDRAKYYSDPDFNSIPVEALVSKEYAAERRQLINPERAARSYPAGKLGHGDTIYLTVADKDGNMVSLIQSNYLGIGSGMTPTELGFVLQDRGNLFSLDINHMNVYEPGKRPFHTIIPAFVTKEGKPFLSFGVMGGAMQPQGHVQVLVNIIDFGMNIQEAGDAPRINHEGSSQPTGSVMTDGGTVMLESGFDYEVIRELRKKGHQVVYSVGPYGGYQAIMWDEKNKVYYGASESRKDGMAAGY